MAQFYNMGFENNQELRAATNIAFNLFHSPSQKISRTLKALYIAMLCGSISIHQVLVCGCYGDYRNRALITAGNFLWSMSRQRGLIDRHTDGRVDGIGLFSINKSGYENLIKGTLLLSEKKTIPNVSETDITALKSLCGTLSKKKWKNPKNVNHSSGINDFFSSLLPICLKPPFYCRELNVFQSGDATDAHMCIRYHGSSSFRMDAFAFIKGLHKDDTYIPICYEQDTGTQSGSVIANKMNNYAQLYSDMIQDNKHTPLCLLYGLQCSYDTSKKAENATISDGKDTRESNSRNSILSHLMFYVDLTGDDTIEGCVANLKSAQERTGKGFYSKCISFLEGFLAENPDITEISNIKAYYANAAGDTSTNISYDTLADLDVFHRRRNIIMERLRKANIEYLLYSGMRIAAVQNNALDYYLQFLYPHETMLSGHIDQLLHCCGISFTQITKYDSIKDICTVKVPNCYSCLLPGGAKRYAIFENFSHDLSSRIRIPHFLEVAETTDIPVTIICFFMDKDIQDIKDFSNQHCQSLVPADTDSAFLPASFKPTSNGASNEILFVDMEECTHLFSNAPSTIPLGLTFLTDGTGIYKQLMDITTMSLMRHYIPADGRSYTDRRTFDSRQKRRR